MTARKVTHLALSRFIKKWVKTHMKAEKCDTLIDLVELGMCTVLVTDTLRHFSKCKQLRRRNSFDQTLQKFVFHSWVEFDGKHYDMQNPDGITDWEKLEYFTYCENQ